MRMRKRRSGITRIAAVLLGVAMLCVLFASAAVRAEDGEDLAMAVLRARKIMVGDPDGEMRWEEGVSRAEALKILLVAGQVGVKGMKVSPQLPRDVSPGHWAARYISVGLESGIVRGYEDGVFRPEAEVTVAEFSVMVCRVYRALGGVTESGLVPAAVPGWVAAELGGSGSLMKILGLVGNDVASLDVPLSRRECAESVFRVFLEWGALFDLVGEIQQVDVAAGILVVVSDGRSIVLGLREDVRVFKGQDQVRGYSWVSPGRRARVVLSSEGEVSLISLD